MSGPISGYQLYVNKTMSVYIGGSPLYLNQAFSYSGGSVQCNNCMTAWTKAESEQSNPEHTVCNHGNSDMNTTICRRGCMTSLISALDVEKGNKSSSDRVLYVSVM